jgi:hypothetical protein
MARRNQTRQRGGSPLAGDPPDLALPDDFPDEACCLSRRKADFLPSPRP